MNINPTINHLHVHYTGIGGHVAFCLENDGIWRLWYDGDIALMPKTWILA